MPGQSIILLSCGLFEKSLTEKVREDVLLEFRHPVELRECNMEIDHFYNPVRRQYDANQLLDALAERAPGEALKVMGMYRVDLYIPILTHIYGQARLGGHIGLASLYRLRNEHYGLKADQELLGQRFSKVVVHELGHSFGLRHCSHPVCVMRSSTYVEDLDQKEIHFCGRCRTILDHPGQTGERPWTNSKGSRT